MNYGSVCSGIEAATAAWHPLGWEPAWFSEIEKFPSAVLAHHYPEVSNLGDMTRLHEKKQFRNRSIDLLVGGTPCQSFSVAGLRKGLADPRGNLALHFLKILDAKRPRWVVWENVPGVLSSWSNDPSIGPGFGWERNDFDTFASGLRELGYGLAWRILDAQYIGVPQRRRRVFVVGYFGDWRRAAAVLFERHSLSGNPPPSREAGEGFAAATAPSLTASGRGVERTGESRGQDPVVVHTLRAEYDGSEDGTGRGTPIVPILEVGKGTSSRGDGPNGTGIGKPGDPMYTLQAGAQHAIAFGSKDSGLDASFDVSPTFRSGGHNGSHANAGVPPAIAFTQNQMGDVCPAMGTNQNATGRNTPKVKTGMQVRRLTPRECERLQGFPDDYTKIPFRGGQASDGPRYKALGNSMAVPVMRWIGKRIEMVEKIVRRKA